MWSTVGSAFKLTLRYVDPAQMLWFASFISIVVLFAILVLQGKTFELFRQGRKDILRSALYGLLNPFLFYLVLFTAYDLLLTQEAMVINFSWPITLTILSALMLKQHITYRSYIAIFVSFSGIVLIAIQGDITSLRFTNPQGVALALFSTVIWSLFWIYNIKDRRDETLKLLLNFVAGFIFITAFILVTGRAELPSWQAVAGAVYIGVFEMGIAYVFWLKALQLSTTTDRVSILIFLAPFVSLVIINLTVGEAILPSTLFGLVFIVSGILLQRLWKRKG